MGCATRWTRSCEARSPPAPHTSARRRKTGAWRFVLYSTTRVSHPNRSPSLYKLPPSTSQGLCTPSAAVQSSPTEPNSTRTVAKSLDNCHCERSEAIPTILKRALEIASSLPLLATTDLRRPCNSLLEGIRRLDRKPYFGYTNQCFMDPKFRTGPHFPWILLATTQVPHRIHRIFISIPLGGARCLTRRIGWSSPPCWW
jgi:hypothetical protein